MLGVVLSDGDIIVKKILYLKIYNSTSFSTFFLNEIEYNFQDCSRSHNNSDEFKQSKKRAGVENYWVI